MEIVKLIGVLIVIAGFILKLDTLAVVVTAGLATGLVAGMSPLEILDTLGTAFITNRTATLFILTLPVIGLCERNGLKDKAVDFIKSSEPVPDFNFIENELNNLSPEIEKTVFAMHVKPFEFVFNNNVAKIFQLYVNQFPKVQFCLYGHEHKFAVDDLFNDGVLYFQCPCIDKRIYLLFTIKEDGTYDYETVEF